MKKNSPNFAICEIRAAFLVVSGSLWTEVHTTYIVSG